MTNPTVALPEHYRLACFDVIDSTMNEALRCARAGDEGGLWIWALEQTSGRARNGREWESVNGNLFASLLLKPNCSAETALQLSLLASVAAYDAVAELGAVRNIAEILALKWPNDLLASGKKIAGILLERFDVVAAQGAYVIIGTGLNLTAHPAQALYPASDLSRHGIAVEPGRALEVLAAATDRWLSSWDAGSGFEILRQAWLQRSIAKGQTLRVSLDAGEVIGVYAGIDQRGALRLIDDKGHERRITAGDVFVT